MINKKKLNSLGLIAAFSMMGAGLEHENHNPVKSKKTDEQSKDIISRAEKKRNKKNGLTEFFYGTNSVWAINQKTADNKARKKNWL